MIKNIGLWALFVIGAAHEAQATQAQEDLIWAIVAASTNTTDQAEHRVEIDGCTMTTWVYKPKDDHGMQLWSSFVFDMRMTAWNMDGGVKFIASDPPSADSEGEDARGLAMIRFKMLGDAVARHEIPEFCIQSQARSKPVTPSSRVGVEPYVFHDSLSFFILHEGPDVGEKARAFTDLYDQYVLEYCRVIG